MTTTPPIRITLSRTETLATQRLCRNAKGNDLMIAFVINTRLEEALTSQEKEGRA